MKLQTSYSRYSTSEHEVILKLRTQTGIGECRAKDLWHMAVSDIGTLVYFYDKTGVWHTLGAKSGIPLRAVHGLDGVKPPVIKILY